MPFESSQEIAAIVDMLNTPIKHALQGQDSLKKMVDSLDRRLTIQEERYATMAGDFNELKNRVAQAESKILDNQQKKFVQTIAIQGTILLIILGAFISSYFIPQLFGSR